MNTKYLDTSVTKHRTDHLFTKRNFWTGLSSILNVFGGDKKFNTSRSSQEADIKALRSDWEMIGQDFKESMSKTLLKDFE
jgi:hypothetical protein